MIEFYPQIKAAHVGLVMLSGALFALRGAFVLAGMRWPLSLPVKWASYTIDTALLTAAAMLLTILHGTGMFANGWLTVKMVLLVVYIVLGIFALTRARTTGARVVFFLGALATYGMMYSIARAHHPFGWLLQVVS
ncbi:SirB2 family protein [Aerolutibacter ruishenii]|uniref:Putative membrane protein SirB2 n=1 Tax=Aerolutibacter ruishenii TaxID=686800 RepID=A0A562LY86_9GAMM|nr:SirB2 family protein [Lysobacter ruishenii]TWI12513.1 putative membrane protein SirB2 [Lysobacter ruishenii]